jgi:hypothetical protein
VIRRTRVYLAGPDRWVSYCERCSWASEAPTESDARQRAARHECLGPAP